MNGYIELWLALCGVLVALLAKADVIIGYLKAKRQTAKDKVYQADLLALGESLQILEHTTQEVDITGVDRAVLFRGHNCGGVPTIGKPYYADVVFSSISEKYADKMSMNQDDIRDKYTNILVDAGYVSMLAEAIDSKSHDLIVDVSTMPECLLKSIYEMEGVEHSIISFLATRNGVDIIYMSQSRHDSTPFTDSQIINARLSANKMRQLLKEHG